MSMLPLRALVQGVRLCVGDPAVRRSALRPWLIGIVCALAAIAGVFYGHGYVVGRIVSPPSSILTGALYVAVWLVAALSLTALAIGASLMIVMALSGIYQTQIAEHVLRRFGAVQESAPGSGIRQAMRTISIELTKLLWMVPVFVALFLLGLIPLLWPIVLPLTAWFIAYQAIDFALDVLGMGVLERLGYAVRHSGSVVLYGLGLVVVGLIPFAIIVLPPIAVAGGAYLVAELERRRVH